MTATALFVVVGATGDLTRRKLIPALFELITDGEHRPHVLGIASKDLGDDGFRRLIADALLDQDYDKDEVAEWCERQVGYQAVGRDEGFDTVAKRVADLDIDGPVVYYLALPPAAFGPTIRKIGEAGLHEGEDVRLVVEKPFGHDLESAHELNETVHEWFEEAQVFRIDHYLGKATVQNLLVFRFANSIFESSWNRDRIERVEITVAEDLTVAGRGKYYDEAGVVRDIVQNHLTQLLTLVAMEPPAQFTPTAVRNEKVKVLRSIGSIDLGATVLGQYTAGTVDGEEVSAYRGEPDVDPASTVPTYAAMRVEIDNWRWRGVPFFLRSGKALPRRVTEIAVIFQPAPVQFFDMSRDDANPDVLLLRLQPDEGFELRIDVKLPTDPFKLEEVPLSFDYDEAFGEPPDAYETLLADVLEGDQTLFVRADEVEEAWRLHQPLLDAALDPLPYAAGTWGPDEANERIGHPGGWITGE